MKQVIAIDGPSGSGKTTIARVIASELGFHYLDTGALYRAVALALKNHMIQTGDSDDKLQDVLNRISVTFSDRKVFLDGADVSEEIRSKEMDHISSVFSARKVVRDYLLDAQRNAALQYDLVVEGRDTTTVIFPKATRKVYLDASIEVRAKRRYLQYRVKKIDISMDEAIKKIMERDARDAGRDIAPLKRAPEALFIDSSDMTVEQVKNRILEFIRAEP